MGLTKLMRTFESGSERRGTGQRVVVFLSQLTGRQQTQVRFTREIDSALSKSFCSPIPFVGRVVVVMKLTGIQIQNRDEHKIFQGVKNN